jgi:hypothetical protein
LKPATPLIADLNNIYVHFGKKVVFKLFEILVGTNCAPLIDWFGLWCLTSLSTIFQVFVAVSVIGEGTPPFLIEWLGLRFIITKYQQNFIF